MEQVTVSYDGGDRFRISMGSHTITTDQPLTAGGTDHGPTPTELFVGSLVGCMGYYAERFLRRNDIDPHGLELTATFRMTTKRPFRVAAIQVVVGLPPGFPDRLLEPIRRVMHGCSVHNSLRDAPEVKVSLNAPKAA